MKWLRIFVGKPRAELVCDADDEEKKKALARALELRQRLDAMQALEDARQQGREPVPR